MVQPIFPFSFKKLIDRLSAGLNKVRFVSPVPVGKKVELVINLKDVEEIPSKVPGQKIIQNTLVLTLSVENQPNKPAMVAEWLTRVYFAA